MLLLNWYLDAISVCPNLAHVFHGALLLFWVRPMMGVDDLCHMVAALKLCMPTTACIAQYLGILQATLVNFLSCHIYRRS